ncbi:ECF transporter S component [Pseudoflavonifractor sp. MCC625]|nr:ECF transporter S component [Pseudoflavonifractor sp. MCC625]
MGGGGKTVRRSYDESQIVAAQRKRTKVSAALIFFAIPVVIALGIVLFNDRNYMVISLVILALTMAPFFMVFERRKPKAREIVLIALMCALTVCAQLICGVTVPLRAGTAIIIACGIALGPEAGFLIGALARFVLNFYAGQGPWSPWQMFCWGILGFLAGQAFNRANLEKKKSRNFSVVMGPVLCVLFMGVVAYLTYVLFPPADGKTFWGWRLYVFGAIGLLLGVLVQRKRLPVDDVTLSVFTFFTTFIIYGGAMNIFTMISAASIPGNPEISWDALKIYYISGVPYDFAHAGTAAIFNFIFGEKLIQKLERIKLKYGIYR